MLSDLSLDMQSTNSIQEILKQICSNGAGENGEEAYSIGMMSPLVKYIANIIEGVGECCGLQEGVVGELAKEVENLFGTLEEMKNKTDRLSDESHAVEKKMEKLQQDLKNNNYIEEMATEAECKLLLRLQDVEKEPKDSKATIDNLEGQVLWSHQEKKRLEQLSEESRLQMQEMSLLIKELNDKLGDAKSEIRSLDEANRNLNEYKDKNEASKNQLQLRNEELEGLVKSLQEELLNNDSDNYKFLREIEDLRIHINREESKNRDLTVELLTLQEKFDDLNLKSQVVRNERVVSDELSDANTKVDNFTQTEIEHGCSKQEEIQKESRLLEEPEPNSKQDYSEINGLYDGQYELIKEEHLSQVSYKDRTQILRRRGYSEDDIAGILVLRNSWYTKVAMPLPKGYEMLPSLVDSRCPLRKKVCVWSIQDHDLTESQKELNKRLLDIIQHLDWYDDGAPSVYDNGSVFELEKLLKGNEGNPDLEVILNLRRGGSKETVLHALSGVRTYEMGRDQENRPIGLLLAAGADRNAQDSEGNTPLHHAAAIGNDEAVNSLLWKSADPNICNRQGETPQQIAIDGGCYNVVGLFLTKKQKELSEELYRMFDVSLHKDWHINSNHSECFNSFTRNLREFLDKHKNNPDLKVVLSIEKEGKLEAVQHIEYICRHNRDVCIEAMRLLSDAGLPFYGADLCKQRKSYDYLWNSLEPNQEMELDKFLCKVTESRSIEQLEDVVHEAIKFGIKLNFNRSLPPEDPIACNWYSFTDYVMRRISKLKMNPKIASDIVCSLISRGAVFYDRNSINLMDELQLKFKDHEANVIKAYASYINNTDKFIEAARNATSGKLCGAKIDRGNFCLEYSESSIIDVAKITNRMDVVGCERHVVKFGKNEVEIMVKNGTRNYVDLTDDSDILLTLGTSLGGLEVRLYPDKQNKDRVKVEVSNQNLLERLKNCNEKIGENVLWGGLPVNQAIEQGFFTRLGERCQYSETINSTAQTMTDRSKIFGLEEEIIEKAEKQGDKEQKSNIPDDFCLGQAINNGSCFFDSFRQSLEQQKGIKVTVEQLRNECKRFAQDNPPEWFIIKIGNDFDEVESEFVNRGTTCDQYINSIENNQFWGRTDIEGRILCRKYDVKLHVVESNPLNATGEQQDPYLHQQVDSSGSISAGEYNRIDYDDNDVLHIINKAHDHFEPLLNSNKILAKCYSSSPRCNMDELKIESHQHKHYL
ncbi:ankyrin repeat domain-containing protein [Wolbachia endosymbiont (group A) of Gastracanthus pulcherrimus]|uniref:ankyrin repeat domain-containing protein n=1 Tax=Wolbachia endosymbiont (group A) of Gastracanthus pulcherrimus TaxID=3066200 RepID=UPI00333E7B53